MYLNDLGKREQAVLYQLAHRMVLADGIIAPEEEEMLDALRQEFGEPEGEAQASSSESFDALCGAVTDPRAQAVMLIELASLAQADREYVDSERDLLRQISLVWQIDPLTVYRIEAWGALRATLAWEAGEIIREVMSPIGRTTS